MVKLVFIFSLLINAHTAIDEGKSNAQLFCEGTNCLVKGDYLKSIATFETARNRGLKTSDLYCNLGNAYFKSGKPGEAMVCYGRGLKLSPFDQEMIHNRDLLNASIKIPPGRYNTFDGVDDLFLIYLFDKALFVSGLLLFMSSLLFILSLSLLYRYKRKARLFYKGFLLVSIPVLILSISFLIYFTSGDNAIIIKNTDGKTGPGELAKNSFQVKDGEKVLILNYFDGWYKIKKYDGSQAWLPGLDLVIINQ